MICTRCLINDFKHKHMYEICFSLSALVTFENLCICLWSAGKSTSSLIILPKSVMSDMKFVFLFLHLLLLWTSPFTYAQSVSYFSIHLITFIILTKSVVSDINFVFSFFPLATSVNLCICWWCSGGELLFTTSCIPFYHSDTKCGKWCTFFSFSTCYFCELVHLLMLRT